MYSLQSYSFSLKHLLAYVTEWHVFDYFTTPEVYVIWNVKKKLFLYWLFKLFNLHSIRLVVFQIVFLKINLKTINNSMPFSQFALSLSLDILPACSWSYLTLCNPVDSRPPGSSFHRILQTRILEWAAVASSRGSSRSRDWNPLLLSLTCIGRQVLYHQHRLGSLDMI